MGQKPRSVEGNCEVTKLTPNTAIARTYNQLARLYVVRDIAQQEVARREQIDYLTAVRVEAGVGTEVERKTAHANLTTSRASLTALDGSILTTRYQLGTLIGAGPDRGLAIERPAFGVGEEVRLPDNLPADLLSRRPDIVTARWRVDAIVHEVKVAKPEFYPDINLRAGIGFDSLGFGRFLNTISRTASVGPAVHLPFFDENELRQQLKDHYPEFQYAVGNYNQTLVTALVSVATRLAQIRSIDEQLVNAQAAQQDAQGADELTITQYIAGFASQLKVLNADVRALEAAQSVASLKMKRPSTN